MSTPTAATAATASPARTITLQGQRPHSPRGTLARITVPFDPHIKIAGDRYKELSSTARRGNIWVPLAGDFHAGDQNDIDLLISFLWPLLHGRATICLTTEPPKFRKDYETLLVCRAAIECADARSNRVVDMRTLTA
jgi:hypothetical protein